MSAARRPRVIVTRPAAQASAAVRQLQSRGIDAVALPLIEIAAVDDSGPLVDAWRTLASHRLVVFVSVNAVFHFFAARPSDLAWPATALAATPGPGTAASLRSAGVDPSRVVEPADDAVQLDSEALWQRLREHDWQGARVLVVRGDGGRDWLAEQLAAAGATVDAVTAYVRRPPAFDAVRQGVVDAALREPRGHVWLFSSSEAIGHLVDKIGDDAATSAAADDDAIAGSPADANAGADRDASVWADAIAIATHPRIAARARQAGFGTVQEVRPGFDDVVACIQSMRP